MAQLKAGGRTYDLRWVTGKVVGQGKHVETHVSGSGSGGGSSNVPFDISISSSTTVHNDIFLTDANGKEHSFQLSGFDIACREGHDLTVMWATGGSNPKGRYIVVINHTTSQQYFDRKAVEGLFMPMAGCWLMFLSLFIVFAAIHQNSTFFDRDGMPMGWQIAWTLPAWGCVVILIQVFFNLPVMKYKANRFVSTFRFEDYKERPKLI